MKEHLKAAGVEPGVNKISADNASLDDVRRQCKAVLDALNRSDFHVDIGSLKIIKMKDMEIKSAKALFGDAEKKIENVKELPESIRNLLLAGALIMKHSNTAAPRQRHVYITPDLKSVPALPDTQPQRCDPSVHGMILLSPVCDWSGVRAACLFGR